MTIEPKSMIAMGHGRRVAALLWVPMCLLFVGCAGKEFRAFDGPSDPARDVRLSIDDARVRVVSVDGVAVPRALGEASGDRTFWVRGDHASAVRLTLGIAPHPAVMEREQHATDTPIPAAGVTLRQFHGYQSEMRYPGSSRNQRVTFAAQTAGRYVVTLDGKLDAEKKPVWGFVITDPRTGAPTPIGPIAWETNATGGTDATPWNLWDLPDDAIEVRTLHY